MPDRWHQSFISCDVNLHETGQRNSVLREIQARWISLSYWAAGLAVMLCLYTCFLTGVVFGDFLTVSIAEKTDRSAVNIIRAIANIWRVEDQTFLLKECFSLKCKCFSTHANISSEQYNWINFLSFFPKPNRYILMS